MATPKKQVNVKSKSNTKDEVHQREERKAKLRFILLTSLATLFLLIANSALWVNKTIFNTENFSQITTDSLLSESSRNAVATEIVDKALADRPVAKNVAGEQATKFISGLLATSQAETAVQKVSSRLQIMLTSEHSENVELDLTGIKQTVTKLIDLAGSEQQDSQTAKVESIPDKITIVDTSKIPTFYQLGTLFLWLAPIALISGMLILAAPHIKAKKLDLDLLMKQGLIVLGGWIIGLLVGPLFRPPFLAQFNSSNIRTVAENLYNSFIASFNAQMELILGLSLIMIFVPLLARLYRFIKSKR